MSGPVVGDPTVRTDPRKVVAVASIARTLLELWRIDSPVHVGTAIQIAAGAVFNGVPLSETRETQRLAMVRLLCESDREEPEKLRRQLIALATQVFYEFEEPRKAESRETARMVLTESGEWDNLPLTRQEWLKGEDLDRPGGGS